MQFKKIKRITFKKISKMQKFLPFILCLLPALATANTFQNDSVYSASEIGTALAGNGAIADNAATLRANPASISHLPGLNISVSDVMQFNKQKYDLNIGSGDAGKFQNTTNFYITYQPKSFSDLTIGLGVYSPYELSNEYILNNGNFAKSDVSSLTISPTVSYKISPKISLGISLNYEKLNTRWKDVTYYSYGSNKKLGFSFGVLLTPSDNMRVGVNYSYGANHKIKTNVIHSNTNLADNIENKVRTPSSLSISVWQKLLHNWEVMGNFTWTRYNNLHKNNKYNFTTANYVLSNIKHNAWRLSWGTIYNYNQNLKLKFGFAYEHSPLRVDERALLMPDHHRYWFSTGLKYDSQKYGSIDLGYSYIYSPRADSRYNKDGFGLYGDYKTTKHLLGIQYSLSL